jgi:ABC-type histidine transport system ATPase subunit
MIRIDTIKKTFGTQEVLKGVTTNFEQGKTNLNMDSVNLVLKMFGHELAAVNSKELNNSES